MELPSVKEPVTAEISSKLSRGIISYGEEERANLHI